MAQAHGANPRVVCRKPVVPHAYDVIALVPDPRLLDHLDQFGKYGGEVVFAVDILTCLAGYLGASGTIMLVLAESTNFSPEGRACVSTLRELERMLAMAYVWRAAFGHSQPHLNDLVEELVCTEPQ